MLRDDVFKVLFTKNGTLYVVTTLPNTKPGSPTSSPPGALPSSQHRRHVRDAEQLTEVFEVREAQPPAPRTAGMDKKQPAAHPRRVIPVRTKRASRRTMTLQRQPPAPRKTVPHPQRPLMGHHPKIMGSKMMTLKSSRAIPSRSQRNPLPRNTRIRCQRQRPCRADHAAQSLQMIKRYGEAADQRRRAPHRLAGGWALTAPYSVQAAGTDHLAPGTGGQVADHAVLATVL